MQFFFNGNEIAIGGIEVLESLDYYAPVFIIGSKQSLPMGIYNMIGTNGESVDFMSMKVEFSNGIYSAWLMPTYLFDMFEKTFNGFNGFATIEDLGNILGFKYSGPKSNKTYWDLPVCKYRTLLTKIEQYASIVGGGGTHIFLELDSVFRIIDYRFNFDNVEPSIVYGTSSELVMKYDWLNNVHGEITVEKYFPDGTEVEEITIMKDTSHGTVCKYLSNRDATNLPRQYFNNRFYDFFYTSRSCYLTSESYVNVSLGDIVKLNSDGSDDSQYPKYMVRSIQSTYSETGLSNTKLQLVGGIVS